MGRLGCSTVCAIWLLGASAYAQPAATVAGRVKVTSGAASIQRAGASVPARVGLEVFETDVLQTGPDGHLGVTLKDDTRLSLSPGSAVRLDSFRYDPAQGRLGLALKFLRGTAAYVSGGIAKLSPDAVRLETPAAIVGVRGTTLVIQVSEE